MFVAPGQRTFGAVERELEVVAVTSRCLREDAGPHERAGETYEHRGVVRRRTLVQPSQVRDDGLGAAARRELRQIEPVRADVRDDARRAAARRVDTPVVALRGQ